MPQEKASYSHGHHSSVVSSHARRTPSDSASFLLPHLTPSSKILDLGCGPGSITVGLAKLVPQGSVTGVDASASVIDSARAHAAAEGVTNVSFEVADANALEYPEGSFDAVFCHQVLQHVGDPVQVLREMARVAKPEGVVAARESDYGTFGWWPRHEKLQAWWELYMRLTRVNGGEPEAGKMLHVWAREAGFETGNVESSVTSWCYTGQRAREWGESWAERTVKSRFGEDAKGKGLATEEEIQAISEGWRDWSTKEDLWFNIPSGEMLYRKP